MKDEKIIELFGSWSPAVIDFCRTSSFDAILKTIVEKEDAGITISPSLKNIFKAFQITEFKNTYVIWFGLDPYFNGEATGISMGLPKDWAGKIPATHKILMMELDNTYGSNAGVDPTFETWAKQGILMLNKALTIENKVTKGHIELWRPFMTHLCKWINEHTSGLIIAMFGKEAQKLGEHFNPDNFWLLNIVHPAAEAHSGGSAGFFHSNFYKQINDILWKQHKHKIQWLPEED